MSKKAITHVWDDDDRLRKYVARSQASARTPNAAVLAQLRYRVARGEDADAVLDELQVSRGARRQMYLDALGAPVSQPPPNE